MVNHFFPPVVEEHLPEPWTHGHPFLRKLRYFQGISVVNENGLFVNQRYVVPEEGDVEGVDYFVGGHHYTVSDQVAALLTASGYEVTIE